MNTIKIDAPPKPDQDINPSFNWVGAGYFSAIGIPLIARREFTDPRRSGVAESCRDQSVHGALLFRRRQSAGTALLYGVTAEDSRVIAASAILLVLVSAAAGYLPALRATRALIR